MPVSASMLVRCLKASSGSVIAGSCYPQLVRISRLLLLSLPSRHLAAMKGMPLALLVLRKPRIVHLFAVGSTDIYAPGISKVSEKIVFDGDGGNSKLPPIAELAPITENVAGEEDESDEL